MIGMYGSDMYGRFTHRSSGRARGREVWGFRSRKHFVINIHATAYDNEARLIIARDEKVVARGMGVHHQDAVDSLEEASMKEHMKEQERCESMYR